MSTWQAGEPPSIPTDTIANRLILARAHAGHVSIREAAIRCHLGRGAWQNWERGYSTPRLDDLRRIAHGLNVDPAWLANGGPLTPPPGPGHPHHAPDHHPSSGLTMGTLATPLLRQAA